MSTATFGFQFLHPEAGGRYDEGLVSVDAYQRSEGGRTAVLARATKTQFVAEGTVQLPDNAGNKPSDFWTFWDARQGRVDTFLFKAKYAYNFLIDAESLGTATGATAGETFTPSMKYVHHTDFAESATTLVVKSGGVVQVLTTDYTVTLNGTTPTVTTTASFDAGAVTATYEFWTPVRFRIPRPSTTPVVYPVPTWSAQETVQITVQFEEEFPGARFA